MKELALMLARLAHVSAEASLQIRLETIRMARDHGASWAEIGAQLGLSRQAAHKRFGAQVGELVAVERKVVANATKAGVGA